MLGGSAAVMLFTDPFGPTVGASGAIFGLMGGLLVVFKRFKFDMRQLFIVLAINLYLSFQLTGISWQAHVGGLVVGAAATAAMVYPSPAIRKKVQIGSVVLILVVIAAAVIVPGQPDPRAVLRHRRGRVLPTLHRPERMGPARSR